MARPRIAAYGSALSKQQGIFPEAEGIELIIQHRKKI
jgi:hypothetical protein